jgi:hypothetical protein
MTTTARFIPTVRTTTHHGQTVYLPAITVDGPTGRTTHPCIGAGCTDADEAAVLAREWAAECAEAGYVI